MLIKPKEINLAEKKTAIIKNHTRQAALY